MREWLNRAVSKTVEPSRAPWVRIPPSPPGLGSETLTSGRFHCRAWPADCGAGSGAPTGRSRIAVVRDLQRFHNCLPAAGAGFGPRGSPAGERWACCHAVPVYALQFGSEGSRNLTGRWGIQGLPPKTLRSAKNGAEQRQRPESAQGKLLGTLSRFAESADGYSKGMRVLEGLRTGTGERRKVPLGTAADRKSFWDSRLLACGWDIGMFAVGPDSLAWWPALKMRRWVGDSGYPEKARLVDRRVLVEKLTKSRSQRRPTT